ncbi:HNH endonuclease [Enterococcus faecium]|nr:HNH endonuclease [Enterococcus faecium]
MCLVGKRLRQAKANGGFQRGLTKEKIIKAKGNKCCWCGCECTNEFEIVRGQPQPLPHTATIEHLIPIAKGGQHNMRNVAIACHKCNQEKADKPLDKWIVMMNTKKVR